MISGRVLAGGEAVVTVQVRGPSGQTARVEAMVDTGFNDELTLPPWVISKLALEFRHEANYVTTDGATSATRLYAGYIEWHGAWRELLVAEMDNDPLLGMVLMRECHLGIDVKEGGKVEIRPLNG